MNWAAYYAWDWIPLQIRRFRVAERVPRLWPRSRTCGSDVSRDRKLAGRDLRRSHKEKKSLNDKERLAALPHPLPSPLAGEGNGRCQWREAADVISSWGRSS